MLLQNFLCLVSLVILLLYAVGFKTLCFLNSYSVADSQCYLFICKAPESTPEGVFLHLERAANADRLVYSKSEGEEKGLKLLPEMEIIRALP